VASTHLLERTAYVSTVDFRVLGPVEVDADGRSLVLGGPKQKAVLALLIAAGSKRVSTDALITGLYGDEAAPGTRRTIHTYVSNLRHDLGERLTRQGEGYVLTVAPDETDAARFESLYRDGAAGLPDDPVTASRLLREALDLWRGHAYADVDGGPLVAAEISRLSELRVAALQGRIDADLALGLHKDLVGELQALVAEYPFHERFRAQLMLALYRSGRQAEALRAFTAARQFLGEELGVDPGPELRQLEDQILGHDPGLDIVLGPVIERRAVLVADLADALADADPLLRDQVLAARDATVDRHVDGSGGVVFGVRGTAVYVAVPDIVAALDLARAVAGDDVKVAVDFGDVESRHGEVTGPPVARSARLVATSHPGQVVLSQQAQAALDASGTTGWGVKSLGRHQLRGVDEPLMIYQAVGNGLVEEFPALVLDRLPPPVPGGHPAIAGYEVREELGEDEVSLLYRAYQHSMGREVTLRSFRHDIVSDRRFIRRFEAEAQRLALLEHPHILPVLDYWRDPERAVIVSPRLNVHSLAGLGAPPVDLGMVVPLMERVGAALAHAHDHGVVHGDLSPAAVVFESPDTPFLTGLGLASMTAGIVPPRTGRHTAPEAATAGPTVTADVYSMGVILADLLDGTGPGDGPAVHVGGPLGDVISAAIAPDPRDRPPSVRDLVAELARATGRGVTSLPARSDARNPYKGLDTFTEADAADFFGRDALVDELLDRVRSGGLTLVVGPSGIGKSSVVRAGLVPRLRSGALPGSEQWLITDMFPAASPFDELAVALARVSTRQPSGLIDGLRSGRLTLDDAVSRLTDGATVVLVIDQFEELYTHVPAEEERRSFLDTITTLAGSDPANLKVVATLRADFFDKPLEYADFGAAVRDRILPVPAMSVSELADAVRRPADQVGVAVDDDMVTAMAEEAAGQAGGLPLLEYTLAELFEHRDQDRLTLAGYRADGGLAGSIGRRAEEVFGGLSPAAQAAAREVFIRLVTVDEDSEDTRRRVRRSELDQLSCGPHDVAAVLDAFGSRRLLTFDRDATSRGPTVEVAHEAILRDWERLAGWIDDARNDLLIRRRIDSAAREWDEAGRDPSYLIGGARLEQAEAWSAAGALEVTTTERDFIADSRHTADTQRRRRRNARRLVVAGLTVALVTVSALALAAVARGREAERRALENRTSKLAVEAVAVIDDDPDLAILLALEAYHTSRQVSDVLPVEVLSALHTTVQASRLERIIADGAWAGDLSPDGELLATSDVADRRSLVVYEFASGAQVAERRLPHVMNDLAYSPDGGTIAAMVVGETGGVAVLLVDSATLEVVGELAGEVPTDGDPIALDWSSDGQLLAADVGPDAGTVEVWDIDTGMSPPALAGAIEGAIGARFVPGERTLAVERDGAIEFIDVDSGEVEESLVPPAEDTLFEFSPDGRSLIFPDPNGRQYHVLRLGADTAPATFPHVSPLQALFSPDGGSVVIGGNADAVTVLDLESGRSVELGGHGAGGAPLSYASDELLVTAGQGGTMVWNMAPEGVAELGNLRTEGTLWFDSQPGADDTITALLRSGPEEVTAASIDLSTGASRPVARFWTINFGHPVASPDGTLVAGSSLDPDNRVASVVDVASGDTIATLRPCELVKTVDAVRLLALIEAPFCHDESQEALEDEARRGIVDLRTGELVGPIDIPGFIAHAALGRPGTIAEDVLLFHTFPPDVETRSEVQFRRASTGELLTSWEYSFDEILGLTVSFSPDGTQATLAAQTGQTVIFDVAAILEGVQADDAVTVWEDRTTGPNHQTIPMGETFVTSGGATEIRQWDTASGRLLFELAINPGVAAPLLALADGSAVYFPDADGVIRRFLVDVAHLVALAEQRVQRGFTEAECERYFAPGDCPTTVSD
jgi:DNA-binding SARP family transcriptional activator/WD40 repeat protein/tRNA A-37 threonylcarbamoyl transferase component Bud32